jgi:hypothetical protein
VGPKRGLDVSHTRETHVRNMHVFAKILNYVEDLFLSDIYQNKNVPRITRIVQRMEQIFSSYFLTLLISMGDLTL